MSWKNTIQKEVWDNLNEEMDKQPKISNFEKKIRSQSIPIEELDDNRTPIQTGGKDTYLCEKCLDKALASHMKDKDKAERGE